MSHGLAIRARSCILAMLSLTAVASAGPVHAATPAQAASRETIRTESLARLQRVRALVSTGHLEDAVRAAAGLAGVELAMPRIAAHRDPGGFSPALKGVVGELQGATEKARGMARRSLRVDSARLQELLAQGEALEAATRSALGSAGRIPAAGMRRLFTRQKTLAAEATAAVDRARLYSAALLLTRTLDRALPEMRAYAASLPARSTTATGCDVFDAPPILCIGGMGSNTYTSDYELQIDEGGDDVYANSAGGADPDFNGLYVSVAVDISGNDTYATEVPTASGSRIVQGGAFARGIGILVDAAGDDSYVAQWTKPDNDPYPQGALGEGIGRAGVGILADLGGNDSYRVSNLSYRVPAADPAYYWPRTAEGFGVSLFGGLGMLLDAGGNDSYLLESQPTLRFEDGTIRPGHAAVEGFAQASSESASLFADGGGSDSMRMVAATAPMALNDPRLMSVEDSGATVEGFGWAVVDSVAVALSGQGSTTWSAEADVPNTNQAGSYVGGFGTAVGESFAALDDGGGDDIYSAKATSTAVRDIEVGSGCGDCAAPQVDASVGFAAVQVFGGGANAIGMLLDAGGNDGYTTTSITNSSAVAQDRRGDLGSDDAPEATARTRMASSTSWGVGVYLGSGFLQDSGGDDLYECRASSRATATASGESTASATATSGGSRCVGQGASSFYTGGYGDFRDLGGSDTYRAAASSSASALPDSGTNQGVALNAVQGASCCASDGTIWGLALFIDVGGVDADTFDDTPADPACTGTRGTGVWRDCGPGVAVGVNN